MRFKPRPVRFQSPYSVGWPSSGRLPSSDRPEAWPSRRPEVGGFGSGLDQPQPLESANMAGSFLSVAATGRRKRNDWEAPGKVPTSLLCLSCPSSLFLSFSSFYTFSPPACSLCQHPGFRGNSESCRIEITPSIVGSSAGQRGGGWGGLTRGRPECFWVRGGTLTLKQAKDPERHVDTNILLGGNDGPLTPKTVLYFQREESSRRLGK